VIRKIKAIRSEGGQSAVELALLLPLLVVIVLGLTEVGHGINAYLAVQTAARDAARLGAQGSVDDLALSNLALTETARLPGGVPDACAPGAAGVCVTHRTVSGNPAVQVEVCYDHPLLVGVPGLLSEPWHMCSDTTMRVIAAGAEK
jgi:Flp pilus assembly protein TadG